METDDKVKCMYCAEEKRVFSFHELKRGDHICLPGGKFRFNAFQKQYAMYKHHALIKALIQKDTDGSSAMVTMIHFIWTPFSKSIKIRETTDAKNLYNDEIYTYKYLRDTHSPDQSIAIAEKLLADNPESYSLLSYNCEHMVRACIVDEPRSLQIDYVLRNLIVLTHQVGGLIGKFTGLLKVYKIFFPAVVGITPDSFSRKFPELTPPNTKMTVQTAAVTLGCMTLINLVWCGYRKCRYDKEFRSKHICSQCYSTKKKDIWFPFAAYAMSNLGGVGLLYIANTQLFAVVFFSGTVIMSAVSIYVAKKAFRGSKSKVIGNTEKGMSPHCAVDNHPIFKCQFSANRHNGIENFTQVYVDHRRAKLLSTYTGTKEQKSYSREEYTVINSIDEAKVGDVIIYENCGSWIEAVVIKNAEKNLTIMHYAPQTNCAERQITKGTLEINNKTVKRKEFKGYYTYPGNITAKRAISRLNERQYYFFGNTSSDFVHWCKVVQTPSIFSIHSEETNKQAEVVVIPLTGKVYEESFQINWIKTDDELIEGSILNVRGKIGILLSVIKSRLGHGTIYLDLALYNQSRTIVEKEGFTINLTTEKTRIWIFLCDPSKSNNPNIIINKAKECIDTKYKIPAVTSAWEFCKWCVLREHAVSFYKRLKVLNEIPTTGSIVKLKEKIGILAFPEEEKHQLLYYNHSQKAVNEILYDFKKIKEDVWIYWCDSSTCHTYDDIIKRAALCFAKKAIIQAVTSEWEFCKWCVKIENAELFDVKKLEVKCLKDVTKGSILKESGKFKIFNLIEHVKGTDAKLICYEHILEPKSFDISNENNSVMQYTQRTFFQRAFLQRALKYSERFRYQSKVDFQNMCKGIEGERSSEKKKISLLDLTKWSFLSVDNICGILISVQVQEKSIELISYTPNVERKTIKLESTGPDIWLYCNRIRCKKHIDIIERALHYCADKSASQFYKWCGQIENANSLQIDKIEHSLIKNLPIGSFLKVCGQFGILIYKAEKSINLMIYKQTVKEESKTFNYDKQDDESVWIYCTKSTCHESSTIISRALAYSEIVRKDRIPADMYATAWEYCKWCVQIEYANSFKIQLIKKIEELTEGSILKIRDQFGIFSSKNGTKIIFFRYNPNNKTVEEQNVSDISLANENIYIYQPSAKNTCKSSKDISQRAIMFCDTTENRLVEASAWEFCNWCALYDNLKSFDSKLITTRQQLTVGSILKVRDLLGTLSSLKDNKINIVGYNQSQKPVHEYQIDLTTDEHIWVMNTKNEATI